MAACAACGAENREGARFCDSCGAPLAVAAPAREHRKVVTVVFADVTGSTALGERLDTESFRRVLARYFQEAKTIVERHGGTVEKFIGDAVMAVFGIPVVHEDDAVRAVRAAHELGQAIRGLAPELERDYGVALELRLGVNTGEVVTGTEERLATGDAVNVAARLQQAASPGEILIGPETLALARDAVTVEELAPMELKGKQQPMRVYRLAGVTAGAPGLARRLDSPMVGREHERRLLDDAFATAAGRRACALFTLLGTAGVGKSRLAREFLAGVDARVLEGRCLSYGDGITYWPVVEIVKALGDLDGRLVDAPGAAETIKALLGEEALPTSPEEIAWAVRKLFEAVAQERPLVVVFDDMHWGEPTFLDLVEHVADLSRDAPILLLCLARPELLERRPGWGGGKLNATTVLLEPLDGGETAELIDRLFVGEELDGDLAARIRVAAGGNPLFVEEMVAMLRVSGEHEVTVPPTIKALLAARLDQLDPAERSVLERGAVEGQIFHSAAVAALVTPPAPVERQLVGLVRADLVRPERPQLPVGDAYRFRHLLIRDAAYDSLPKATRAELHEAFAGWLEQRGADLVEHDEIVGYHLEQALRYREQLGPLDPAGGLLARRAAEHLSAAARAARLRGDNGGAARLFERAVALGAPGRTALLADLAEMLFQVGQLEAALAALDEALSAAAADGDERVLAIGRVRRAWIAAHLGDESVTLEGVVEAAREAVPVLERLGDDAWLAAVLEVGGRHLFYLGRASESIEMLEQALATALRAGDLHYVRVTVQWLIGAMAFGPTPVSEMHAYIQSLPEAAKRAIERDFAVAAFDTYTHAYQGRIDEARARYHAADALVGEYGQQTYRFGMTMFLSIIERLAGDVEAAERALRRGFDGLGELHETGFRSTVGTMLADALVMLGRLDEAEEVLATALSLAAKDDCDPQVRGRSVAARIKVRRGDPETALGPAREAVALAARTDYLVLHGDALVALAEVERACGATAEAETALRAALELYERKENVVQAGWTRALLADLAGSAAIA